MRAPHNCRDLFYNIILLINSIEYKTISNMTLPIKHLSKVRMQKSSNFPQNFVKFESSGNNCSRP